MILSRRLRCRCCRYYNGFCLGVNTLMIRLIAATWGQPKDKRPADRYLSLDTIERSMERE